MVGYKVIEERMTPSGRIEYYTLPMYCMITEEEINGHVLFKPKDTVQEFMLKKWAKEYYNPKNDEKYVCAFATYESALDYMQTHFKGYFYTRPVIYECECNVIENVENVLKCSSIKFCNALSYLNSFKLNEYTKMTKPEKKKSYGIQYDENEIDGNTDYSE